MPDLGRFVASISSGLQEVGPGAQKALHCLNGFCPATPAITRFANELLDGVESSGVESTRAAVEIERLITLLQFN